MTVIPFDAGRRSVGRSGLCRRVAKGYLRKRGRHRRANNEYEVTHLRNRGYFPFYLKDTNGDRIYQPRFGDAVGVFGISDWFSADEPLILAVSDERITGIDFRVYDPTAVYGDLAYEGWHSGPIRWPLQHRWLRSVTSVPGRDHGGVRDMGLRHQQPGHRSLPRWRLLPGGVHRLR
jgi:hypothetical protein